MTYDDKVSSQKANVYKYSQAILTSLILNDVSSRSRLLKSNHLEMPTILLIQGSFSN